MIHNPLLRSADGRRYLVAQLMDAIGGGLALVVLPWVVLDTGGSRSLAGAAFLIGTVPYVVLGLPAGHTGDRWPRKRVMILATCGQAVAALLLPAAVALGRPEHELPLAFVFACGLGVSAGRVYVDAAAFGAISKLVGSGHFVEGQAALSLVWSLGFLVGPALGGALIGLVGPVQALWVQCAGFAVAALLFAGIRTDLGPDAHHHPGSRPRGTSGLVLVARNPVLRRLTLFGMAWNLVVNLFYALLVVYARVQLHASGAAAGRMLAVGGLAGLVGGTSAPWMRRRLGASVALRTVLVGNAVAAVGLALAGGLYAATVAFGALEATAICFITMLIGERQVRAGPGRAGPGRHHRPHVGAAGRLGRRGAGQRAGGAADALPGVRDRSREHGCGGRGGVVGAAHRPGAAGRRGGLSGGGPGGAIHCAYGPPASAVAARRSARTAAYGPRQGRTGRERRGRRLPARCAAGASGATAFVPSVATRRSALPPSRGSRKMAPCRP
ncbi:MAG: MFS transporter [Gaiellales bacterium]